jgi:hypothetical protein
MGAAVGASCTIVQETVDTSNPTQPEHYSDAECIACGSNGLADDLMCISNTWQRQGYFTCKQ